jgi:predicted esterase
MHLRLSFSQKQKAHKFFATFVLITFGLLSIVGSGGGGGGNQPGAPGTIQLEATSYDATEGTVVNIRVARSDGNSGVVSVDYAIVDGTAVGGSDYTVVNGAFSGTLTYADGHAGNQTISIAITDDNTVELSESFTVTLSNVLVATLGVNSSATVNIIDNDTPETGLKTIMSNGVERSFWLQVPADYDPHTANKPLLIGFHGSGGSHDIWFNGFADLPDYIGNDAIMVFPDALDDGAGITRWNSRYDHLFFADLLAELDTLVVHDENRLFVTGHSNGAVLANEVGCLFGDIIRGIAPVAGAIGPQDCIGSVAALLIHGENDHFTPTLGIVEMERDFWVLYNGFVKTLFIEGLQPFCEDYAMAVTEFPVQFCLHPGGHEWAGFISPTIWNFFSGLPTALPDIAPPPGGGNDKVQVAIDSTLSFTLRFPAGIGPVIGGSAALHAGGTIAENATIPLAFLNTDWDPGDIGAGDEQMYQIPIKYLPFGGTLDFPGDYAVQIVIYVEGGGFPIPAAGIDHQVYVDVEIVDLSTPLVIDSVLTLEPAVPGGI